MGSQPSTTDLIIMIRDLFLIFFLSVQFSDALFFGTPQSSCSSDSQCGTFRRSQCLGDQFIFCFGESRSYSVSGKCVERPDLRCHLGNAFSGGRRNANCQYRECAQCLTSQDCTGQRQYCSQNKCLTRSSVSSVRRNRNRNRNRYRG